VALGDSAIISASSDLTALIGSVGMSVTVTRTVLSQITQRSIFGTPQNYTPTTFTASVATSSIKGNEMEVLAGGKPKEILTFVSQAGTFLENDEVAYSGNTYKVDYVARYSLSGTDLCDEVKASREVQP